MYVLKHLIAGFSVLAVGLADAQGINDNESRLRMLESDLASLSFLFQGFPDYVAGVTFHYDLRTDLDLENYLESLLRAPRESQKVLRESAVFLSSRLYRDGYGQSYLVLSWRDSAARLRQLDGAADPSWTWQDKLLRESLQKYYQLGQNKKAVPVSWSSSDKRCSSVQENVGQV